MTPVKLVFSLDFFVSYVRSNLPLRFFAACQHVATAVTVALSTTGTTTTGHSRKVQLMARQSFRSRFCLGGAARTRDRYGSSIYQRSLPSCSFLPILSAETETTFSLLP